MVECTKRTPEVAVVDPFNVNLSSTGPLTFSTQRLSPKIAPPKIDALSKFKSRAQAAVLSESLDQSISEFEVAHGCEGEGGAL